MWTKNSDGSLKPLVGFIQLDPDRAGTTLKHTARVMYFLYAIFLNASAR